MKRIWILIFCVIFLVIGFNTFAVADDTMCIPMGNITLSPPDGINAKRPHVDFPHARHFDYNCKKCHHSWEKTEEISSCTSSGCHDIKKSVRKTGKKVPAVMYYKKAYHQACIGCHKSIKNRIKKLVATKVLKSKLPGKGPTGCKKCHIEE